MLHPLIYDTTQYIKKFCFGREERSTNLQMILIITLDEELINISVKGQITNKLGLGRGGHTVSVAITHLCLCSMTRQIHICYASIKLKKQRNRQQ